MKRYRGGKSTASDGQCSHLETAISVTRTKEATLRWPPLGGAQFASANTSHRCQSSVPWARSAHGGAGSKRKRRGLPTTLATRARQEAPRHRTIKTPATAAVPAKAPPRSRVAEGSERNAALPVRGRVRVYLAVGPVLARTISTILFKSGSSGTSRCKNQANIS